MLEIVMVGNAYFFISHTKFSELEWFNVGVT